MNTGIVELARTRIIKLSSDVISLLRKKRSLPVSLNSFRNWLFYFL